MEVQVISRRYDFSTSKIRHFLHEEKKVLKVMGMTRDILWTFFANFPYPSISTLTSRRRRRRRDCFAPLSDVKYSGIIKTSKQEMRGGEGKTRTTGVLGNGAKKEEHRWCKYVPTTAHYVSSVRVNVQINVLLIVLLKNSERRIKLDEPCEALPRNTIMRLVYLEELRNCLNDCSKSPPF